MKKCVKTQLDWYGCGRKRYRNSLSSKAVLVMVTTSWSDDTLEALWQQRIICVKGNFHPEERGGEQSGALSCFFFFVCFFRLKAWQTNCQQRLLTEEKLHLPAHTADSRAGKLDTLQTPPWHPTLHLLMNWILKHKASRANYIHCGNCRGGEPRSLPGNEVRSLTSHWQSRCAWLHIPNNR